MNLDQIEKKVREILIGQMDGVVLEDVVDDSDIMKVLRNDVLEFVKALMAIEERFKIEFEQDTTVESITIEGIIEYIEKHQKHIA